MSESAPAIRLELESSPDALTLVRGMLGGAAEILALDAELLDDLKTAVSEACNNVVMHAYGSRSGPLAVLLYFEPSSVSVMVRDSGSGIEALPANDDRVQGVGIPIIQALASEADFRARSSGGTEVRMRFTSHRQGKPLLADPLEIAPEDGWLEQISGEAVASLSPVHLVGGILGRLARALAAKAKFSLDRFSDVYLLTDTIAAHAERDSGSSRITFGISWKERELELAIGPFRAGTAARLAAGASAESGSPLSALSDELDVREHEGQEILRLVMKDVLAEAV